MTSAESIVKHYLERGYSLESLRLLAESREQPLALDMLAVIDRMEGKVEAVACTEDSGPCETAAYAVAAGDDDMVFFIADDDAEVSEAFGIDFDVMAETAPEAGTEESVAEVVVGGDEPAGQTVSEPEAGQSAGPVSAPAASAVGADDDGGRGVWSRLWTRVATAATADIPMGQTETAEPVAEEEPAAEPVAEEHPAAAAEISASEAICEAVVEHSKTGEVANSEPEADPACEDAPETPETMEQFEPACEDIVQNIDETPDVENEIAAQSEISSDYLPGSVAMLHDDSAQTSRERIEAETRRLLEAQQAVAESVIETQAEAADEPAAVEETIASVAEEGAASLEAADEIGASEEIATVQLPAPEAVTADTAGTPENREDSQSAADEAAAVAPAASAALPVAKGMSEAKKSARRERRRERARKRKEKRNALKEAELPEIVLTRSEGTETLSLVEDREDEDSLVPALANEAADSGEAVTEAEEPVMSEPMGLITPNDVIDDDSGILTDAAATGNTADDIAEGMAALAAIAAIATVDERNDRAEPEAADSYAPGDDHLMIIANGGIPGDGEETGEADGASGNNVILFRENFPAFVDEAEEEEEFAAELAAPHFLRMLPPVAEAPVSQEEAPEDDAAAPAMLAETAPEPAAEAPAFVPMGDYLTEATQRDLVRLFCGRPEPEECDAVAETAVADDHSLVVSLEPDPTVDELLAREAAIRTEMENEYQTRLDGFAARLLDVQAAGAISEHRAREKQAELDARTAALEELQARFTQAEAREKELLAQVEQTRADVKNRDEQLALYSGMRDEHKRLYEEFEDLRRAYNEVVGDVMPTLQQERDDLALTVERQCGEERVMRSTLGSMRKRLAVGYSLGAAAAVTLIALPVMNWMNSSGHEKELAMRHQETSELRENLQREVQESINRQNRITELENKVKLASAQINQLQTKNQELVRVQQDTRGNASLAVFRPSESGSTGTPTRASTMALQASPQAGSRLHVNEVRDPAGSIEQVLADNRARQEDDTTQMASSGGMSLPIPLTSVARTETREPSQSRSSLRPAAAASRQNRAARGASAAAATGAAESTANKPVARDGEVLATVKAGEGVAQVVYRQLGTWDPQVVAWVIRENKIRTDRRGNPVIHPNQVLRLPQDGRVGQSASAATRR